MVEKKNLIRNILEKVDKFNHDINNQKIDFILCSKLKKKA